MAPRRSTREAAATRCRAAGGGDDGAEDDQQLAAALQAHFRAPPRDVRVSAAQRRQLRLLRLQLEEFRQHLRAREDV